jgi:hypothetical protein
MAQATPILHPPAAPVTIPFAPGTTKTLALFYARKDVKAALQAAGIRPQTIGAAELSTSARAWLERHPELVARAAETIQKVPALLKIAQREERDRQRREMERRRSAAQNARR